MADYGRNMNFTPPWNEYLEGLEYSKVHSLEELVQWNREHEDLELPPGMSSLDVDRRHS
jgi:hypothetical protein